MDPFEELLAKTTILQRIGWALQRKPATAVPTADPKRHLPHWLSEARRCVARGGRAAFRAVLPALGEHVGLFSEVLEAGAACIGDCALAEAMRGAIGRALMAELSRDLAGAEEKQHKRRREREQTALYGLGAQRNASLSCSGRLTPTACRRATCKARAQSSRPSGARFSRRSGRWRAQRRMGYSSMWCASGAPARPGRRRLGTLELWRIPSDDRGGEGQQPSVPTGRLTALGGRRWRGLRRFPGSCAALQPGGRHQAAQRLQAPMPGRPTSSAR